MNRDEKIREKNLAQKLYEKYVYIPRVQALSDIIAKLLPQKARVLDIGCGDGHISSLIQKKRPDITISGIDVLLRSKTYIPVELFDGQKLPYKNNTFDVVLFIDVLHHADNPTALIREAIRIAKQYAIIKDHILPSLLGQPQLFIRDWLANAPYKVAMPFNYWSEKRWREEFDKLELNIDKWHTKINLYPWSKIWLFEKSLHFIGRLTKKEIRS